MMKDALSYNALADPLGVPQDYYIKRPRVERIPGLQRIPLTAARNIREQRNERILRFTRLRQRANSGGVGLWFWAQP